MRGDKIGEKVVAVTVLVLVVAVGAVEVGSALAVPAIGESATKNQPPPADHQATPTADIEYTCNNVTVSVEPEWVRYDIVVYYRDTVTGDEGKALLGPMNGTVVEPYGPDILFTSVEVIVNGRTIATDYILARCTPETSDRTRSGRSGSETDCEVVGVSARSRNPVPVAIATT